MHFTLLFVDSVEVAESGDGQDGAHEGNGQYVFQDVLFIVSMVIVLTLLEPKNEDAKVIWGGYDTDNDDALKGKLLRFADFYHVGLTY